MARLDETIKRVKSQDFTIQPKVTEPKVVANADNNVQPTVHKLTDAERRVLYELRIIIERFTIGRNGKLLRQALTWLSQAISQGRVPFTEE